MRKHVGLLTVALMLVFVTTAQAAPPLKVKPWVFDPDNSGIADSAWESKIGLPDGNGKANHGLYLEKDGPTAIVAAGGASINFEGELTELGFDYRNDGHCGAGAPRFNIYTTSGVYYFFGCLYGVHTPAPDNPANWTRVRFTAANGFPSDGVSFITDFSEIEVTGIDIVFDEGTDVGPGFAVLDNIDVNGVLIGKPGAAK
jgi:hypothetical protein